MYLYANPYSFLMTDIIHYLSLGLPLLVLSLISLDVMLGNREVKEIVNRQIWDAMWRIALILLVTVFVYLAGMLHFIIYSAMSRTLLHIATFILWVAFIFFEATLLKKLIESGFRPGFSRIFLDILAYLAVLWLIFDRVVIPWTVIAILSTIFMVVILYFAAMFWRYVRISHMIVDPADLYTPALGIRVFSAFMGIMLISIPLSEGYPGVS